MEHIEDKIRALLQKDSWTIEDKRWLFNYLNSEEPTALHTIMQQEFEEKGLTFDKAAAASALTAIHQKIQKPSIKKNTSLFKVFIWTAAACFAGLLAWNLQGWNKKAGKGQGQHSQNQPILNNTDVSPGGNKALLTLGDGSKVVLDDAQDGAVAQEGNTSVVKLADGQLKYRSNKTSNSDSIVYNTLATPRGGQYHIILPDESHVWLNAASSITFPTHFSNNKREVSITGEVYFEIAHNAVKPFTVHTNQAAIQVLGTHFNVNAYPEEKTLATTLLKGSVKIQTAQHAITIKPGQQAQVSAGDNIAVDNNADLQMTMAWKNGQFDFAAATIDQVMCQISRWYNVDVVYEGKKTKEVFYADIPRSTMLSDLLKALEQTGKIKFIIEGGKIYVRNK